MSITDRRLSRIKEVVRKRQFDLTLVLENVHDTHNIGAVMRSCDSVGIKEIYVLHNEKELVKDYLVIGKQSSSGARKWVDVHFFNDTEACFTEVKKKYKRIYGTHLNNESKSLYDLEMTESLALVFGNEREGITKNSLPYLDGNFVIPQVGMVRSLNISVACAVTLYEVYRQRLYAGLYEDQSYGKERKSLESEYIKRHSDKFKGRAHELRKRDL